MDFWTAVITCLKKYITFSGRANRREYWYFNIFCTATMMALLIMERILNDIQGNEQPELPYLMVIASYILILPMFAVTVRRFHDINRSGWWILAMIVSYSVLFPLWEQTQNNLFLIALFIISLTNLVWTCQKGHNKKNDYGLPPSKFKKRQI